MGPSLDGYSPRRNKAVDPFIAWGLTPRTIRLLVWTFRTSYEESHPVRLPVRSGFVNGWISRARTYDILVNSEALYQLSYYPINLCSYLGILARLEREVNNYFVGFINS